MSTTTNTRAALPLEPLVKIAAARAGENFTTEAFARLCGTSAHAIDRWRASNSVPWISADNAAVSLGLHPILVWGDDWLNVKGDFDKLAAEAVAELEQQMVDAISAEGLEEE